MFLKYFVWKSMFLKYFVWKSMFLKYFSLFFQKLTGSECTKTRTDSRKKIASSLREILIFAKPVEKTDFRPQESGFLALRALNFILRLIWLVILVRRSWWPCFRRLSSSPEVLVTYCEFQERSLSLVGTSLKSKSMIF